MNILSRQSPWARSRRHEAAAWSKRNYCGPHLLLYPRVDRDLLLDYQIMGRKVRIATVDLNAKDAGQIGTALLQLTSSVIRPATMEALEAHLT